LIFKDITIFPDIKLIAFALLACNFPDIMLIVFALIACNFQEYCTHAPCSQFLKLLQLSLQFSSLLQHKLFALNDGKPQDTQTVYEMGFAPLDPIDVPVGRMFVKLYPKIVPLMPVHERVHAF
jgi:hypothetical protein